MSASSCGRSLVSAHWNSGRRTPAVASWISAEVIDGVEPPDPAASVARSRWTPWPANLTCRYSGRSQANFETTTWVTSAVDAMPLSIRRGGALRLHHTIGAVAAGIFGTDRAQHPQDRRDHVQHLADVLADLVKLAPAARAPGRVRLQHLLARRCWGSANVAARLLARRFARRLRRRRIIVSSLRRGDVGLEIAQLKHKLARRPEPQAARAPPEDHVLERLHRHAQLLVLGRERGRPSRSELRCRSGRASGESP